MLVLSRQKDESIMIGDEVEITIVDVRGDKVRLGITAPKSIPVHRREIYDAIQREKAQKDGEARRRRQPQHAGRPCRGLPPQEIGQIRESATKIAGAGRLRPSFLARFVTPNPSLREGFFLRPSPPARPPSAKPLHPGPTACARRPSEPPGDRTGGHL